MPSVASRQGSAVDWVESLSPWPEKFGLDTMRALLAELGDPVDRLQVGHVVVVEHDTVRAQVRHVAIEVFGDEVQRRVLRGTGEVGAVDHDTDAADVVELGLALGVRVHGIAVQHVMPPLPRACEVRSREHSRRHELF